MPVVHSADMKSKDNWGRTPWLPTAPFLSPLVHTVRNSLRGVSACDAGSAQNTLPLPTCPLPPFHQQARACRAPLPLSCSQCPRENGTRGLSAQPVHTGLEVSCARTRPALGGGLLGWPAPAPALFPPDSDPWGRRDGSEAEGGGGGQAGVALAEEGTGDLLGSPSQRSFGSTSTPTFCSNCTPCKPWLMQSPCH